MRASLLCFGGLGAPDRNRDADLGETGQASACHRRQPKSQRRAPDPSAIRARTAAVVGASCVRLRHLAWTPKASASAAGAVAFRGCFALPRWWRRLLGRCHYGSSECLAAGSSRRSNLGHGRFVAQISQGRNRFLRAVGEVFGTRTVIVDFVLVCSSQFGSMEPVVGSIIERSCLDPESSFESTVTGWSGDEPERKAFPERVWGPCFTVALLTSALLLAALTS